MRATPISSFIAILMIAAVFLAWVPQAEAGGGVSASDCCEPQLEEADCFCATKFGGWMRQVPCTYDAVCHGCTTGLWECNIQPRKCNWYEEGKVLQRFIEFSQPKQALNCGCEDFC
jgi:hypothetical protein